MKTKDFKLKLLLILSFILCVVGASGSLFMLLDIEIKGEAYAKENIKMETKEVLRTKNKIEVVDVLDFVNRYYGNNRKIVLSKSEDEFNTIEVVQNSNVTDMSLESSEDNKRVKVLYTRKIEENYENQFFTAVEDEIVEAVKFGNTDSYFYPKEEEYVEKVIIKVKEPIEFVADFSDSRGFDVDVNLINNTINYENFRGIDFANIVYMYFNRGFDVKNYNNSQLVIKDYHPLDRTYNIEVSKIPNFSIFGRAMANYNFDVKNVEDQVNVSLDEMEGNVNIQNAKNVLLQFSTKKYKAKIKYNINGEEREIIVNEDIEGNVTAEFSIDAEHISIKKQFEIMEIK